MFVVASPVLISRFCLSCRSCDISSSSFDVTVTDNGSSSRVHMNDLLLIIAIDAAAWMCRVDWCIELVSFLIDAVMQQVYCYTPIEKKKKKPACLT